MHTKITFKIIGAAFISFMLAACGGSGSGSALQNAIDGKNNSAANSSGAAASAIGSDTLQSIEFKDAAPTVINLKGTGGSESSLIRFRTLGQTGLPIKNVTVDFTLSSTVGMMQLTQSSGTSDENGYVSTSVIAGTVSTSMKVVATVRGNSAITAQSNVLVISTGLPDQKSMSLSLEKFNPAGWNHDDITASVNVLLADAYNNPAADGTAVYFTTEGGAIDASCTTTNGGCKVLWKSQAPRTPRESSEAYTACDTIPSDTIANQKLHYECQISRILCKGITDPQLLHACQAERAGRSTILATAVGNESFKDQNGNGIYDPGIDLFATSQDSKCTPSAPYSSYESSAFACDDLPEAYLDINENGVHDSGEYFLNFITDTTNDAPGANNYSPNNGLYNGAFCQPSDEQKGLCSRAPVTIRKQHMVIMSCDDPLLDSNNKLPQVDINPNTGVNIYAVADCNGNPLPLGSTITVGTNPSITVGNQYYYNIIETAGDTPVKLSIAIGGGTKDLTLFTAP